MAFLTNDGVTAKPEDVFYRTGKKLTTIGARTTVPTGLTAGDTFILGGGFAVESRIHQIVALAGTPALTTATDNDIGFFKLESDGTTFTAVDADVLVDGTDLATADATAQDILDLNGSLDRDATIGELVGAEVDDASANGYYVGITFNIAPTVGGVLAWDIVLEEPTAN